MHLRIQSGERMGETVSLRKATTTLGRRPDNDVVLADPSVSGHHAEIRVAGSEFQLVDLGSTNGTRVGGRKVEKIELLPGDVFKVGNIEVALLKDAASASPGPTGLPTRELELEEPEPTHPAAASSEDAGEGVVEIRAERVASAGRRSILAMLVLFIAGAGAAAALFLWRRGGAGAEARASVPAIAGNLLADGSFEGGGSLEGERVDAAWESAASAPAALTRAQAHAATGEQGLGAELAPDEWCFARSARSPAREGQAAELVLQLRSKGELRARVGLELSSANAERPAFVAWAPAAPTTESGGGSEESSDGFGEKRLKLDVPPGYDRVAAVVAAHGEGSVSIDDAGLRLSSSSATGRVKWQESEAWLLGDPATSLCIVRGGRTIVSGLDWSQWSEAGLSGSDAVTLRAEPIENGIGFQRQGAPAAPSAPSDDVLHLVFDVRAGTGALARVATSGPEGYRSHSSEFDVAAADALLVGSGVELVRLAFAKPVGIAARSEGGFLRVAVRMNGLSGAAVELSFASERGAASLLEERAGAAEKQAQYGSAIQAWSELLSKYPFEERLVEKAEASRARLVQSGLERVAGISSEVERARFFDLDDLFRLAGKDARALAAVYAGSEVAVEAETLARAVDLECEKRSGGVDAERLRLAAVLAALEREDRAELATRVRAALDEGSASKGGE